MSNNPYQPPETSAVLESSSPTRAMAFAVAFLVTAINSGLSWLVYQSDTSWEPWYLPIFALCSGTLGFVCGLTSFRAVEGGLFGGWLGLGISLIAVLIVHNEITPFLVCGPVLAILPYGVFFIPAAVFGSWLMGRSLRKNYFPSSRRAKSIHPAGDDVSFLHEEAKSDEA